MANFHSSFQFASLLRCATVAGCRLPVCPPWATLLTYPWDMRYRAGVRSRSVDSQDLPDLLLLRSCLAAVYLDLPRRSRFTLASGCLRQSFSLRSIISPFGLPSAGSVGSHPPGMSHPSGCLYSLPRNRPVAWFPASARWHVFQFVVKSQHPKTGQMARLPNSELGLSNMMHT